jgi:prepilin-type N-terminal cleavage/methylation domain-containing protein
MKLIVSEMKTRNGFTLVELLIAIAIVIILSVIGLTVFTGLQTLAHDSKRRADIEAIAAALENHFNHMPNEKCGNGKGSIEVGDNASAGTYCPVLGDWFSGGSIPKDPVTGSDYENIPTSPSAVEMYQLCATLSNNTKYCLSRRQS